MKAEPLRNRDRACEVPHRILESVETVVRGKHEVVRLAVTALLAHGHLLIEDVPGVGKTTLASALARSIGGQFHRIQFTSDLLPSDIIGVNVWDPAARVFDFKKGPVFANVVLADEVNRTTPRTQSSLLEAMSEGTVSVENETHPLPQPFFVIATQNPVEHFGTYPLPDSQLDRFLMRIRMGYPEADVEQEILTSGGAATLPEVQAVTDPAELVWLQEQVRQIKVEKDLAAYLVQIVRATREWEVLELGVSPRGTQDFYRACQAWAMLEGRDHVVPDDVQELALPVLAHRLIPRDAAADSQRLEALLQARLREISVPL